jgi:hypothetical protein
MTRLLFLFCLASLMAGCATNNEGTDSNKTRSGMTNAAIQPLQDFGLLHDAIPPVLVSITDPYAPPTGQGCVWIGYEVEQLTAVLGPDVDVLKARSPEDWQSQSQDIASNAAVSATRSASTGWIPARGIVRSLSGAEKSERKFLAAFEAGRLRRAYLKGLGEAKGCKPPAAPIAFQLRTEPTIKPQPTDSSAVPPR